MDNPVLYNIREHIAYLTLNRPESDNRLDQDLTCRLVELCAEVNRNPEVYLAVITGAGEVFCTGGEVGRTWEFPGSAAGNPPGLTAAAAVANIECPAIAAINGDALEQGLELALACDIRIASARAKFGLPQVISGRIPQDGGTQRLPRIIGRAKALELILTGEIIDAAVALDIGLVNKVVSHDDLASTVDGIASLLAGKAPLALRYAKEAVNQGTDLTLDQGLRLEADLYFLLHTTADRTEGIQSFLQKRQPGYRGQ